MTSSILLDKEGNLVPFSISLSESFVNTIGYAGFDKEVAVIADPVGSCRTDLEEGNDYILTSIDTIKTTVYDEVTIDGVTIPEATIDDVAVYDKHCKADLVIYVDAKPQTFVKQSATSFHWFLEETGFGTKESPFVNIYSASSVPTKSDMFHDFRGTSSQYFEEKVTGVSRIYQNSPILVKVIVSGVINVPLNLTSPTSACTDVFLCYDFSNATFSYNNSAVIDYLKFEKSCLIALDGREPVYINGVTLDTSFYKDQGFPYNSLSVVTVYLGYLYNYIPISNFDIKVHSKGVYVSLVAPAVKNSSFEVNSGLVSLEASAVSCNFEASDRLEIQGRSLFDCTVIARDSVDYLGISYNITSSCKIVSYTSSFNVHGLIINNSEIIQNSTTGTIDVVNAVYNCSITSMHIRTIWILNSNIDNTKHLHYETVSCTYIIGSEIAVKQYLLALVSISTCVLLSPYNGTCGVIDSTLILRQNTRDSYVIYCTHPEKSRTTCCAAGVVSRIEPLFKNATISYTSSTPTCSIIKPVYIADDYEEGTPVRASYDFYDKGATWTEVPELGVSDVHCEFLTYVEKEDE